SFLWSTRTLLLGGLQSAHHLKQVEQPSDSYHGSCTFGRQERIVGSMAGCAPLCTGADSRPYEQLPDDPVWRATWRVDALGGYTSGYRGAVGRGGSRYYHTRDPRPASWAAAWDGLVGGARRWCPTSARRA